MNSEIVGLENLPNIFIDNIRVDDVLDNIKKITVTACMYDENNHTWRDRGFNISTIMTVITANDVMTKINSGTHVENLDSAETYFVSTKSADSANEVSILESSYKKFKQTFVFTIDISQNPSANVYCHCSILNIDFGIKEFDIFCGPMSGEQVFSNGTLVELSGYFYDPNTNEEFGGPVCSENGKYYKGSYKTDASEEVFYVSEDNMKITSLYFEGLT